jgi:hypothetical protein
LEVHESGHSIQQPSVSDETNADTKADKQSVENEIISIKPQQQQEVTEVQPEENLARTPEDGGDGTRIDTDTSPPKPEQSANTNASDPGSMTATHTSPQSIDVHMTGEDSVFSGPRDKSPVCENCSIKDDRIKKLEDENREMGVRCSLEESSNSELVLQLTAREIEIEKLLEEEHDLSDLPDQYVRQECLSCRELKEKVIELSEALKHTPIRTPDEIPASEDSWRYVRWLR